MQPREFTPVPNAILDNYLNQLKPAEMTVLLVIIRQTLGWMNPRTMQRKHTDWIAGSQLQEKTGYSRKAISMALEGLVKINLIRVTDSSNRTLDTAKERQGKTRLYYSLHPSHRVSPDLSPHAQNICKPWVKISQDMRRKYAQQKKLLQKKLTQY
jgi:hypothetical protein